MTVAATARIGRCLRGPTLGALISTGLITLILNAGCSLEEPEKPDEPRVLRVVLIPDRSPGDINRDFQPLLDYISAQTGITIELSSAENYEDVLDMFASGQVDLARFGGYTYVLANQRSDAQALVTRDVDLRFRSVIIARADLSADGLESLRGRSLDFGPRYSTSGHVMPRVFLQGQGIVPEEFFSEVGYVNNHVDTIGAVAEGEIDAGAVNALILERAIRRHADIMRKIQLVWTSPQYANYIWATQPDMEPSVSHAVREAFLSLTMLDESHAQILNRVGAAGFLPAQRKNYDVLMAYVSDHGLNLP